MGTSVTTVHSAGECPLLIPWQAAWATMAIDALIREPAQLTPPHAQVQKQPSPLQHSTPTNKANTRAHAHFEAPKRTWMPCTSWEAMLYSAGMPYGKIA